MLPGMRRMVLVLTAACVALGLLAAGAKVLLPGALGVIVAVLLMLAAAGVALPAVGGWVALERQGRLQRGERDLFLACNDDRSEQAVEQGRVPRWSGARRWLARAVFGHRHLVGDRVRVKSLDAIRATLDVQGKRDGLPFMDEMAAFCGRDAVVYRVVDKIYDYGRSRRMRPIDDCVLLVWQRCDGAAHGGCQAACYLIWKSDWLEPAPTDAASAGSPRAQPTVMPSAAAPLPKYKCQYTELTGASREGRGLEWGGVFGPWIAGNVGARAFAIAIVTRIFNAIQTWRGGVAYPWQPEAGNDRTLMGQPLQSGDRVRVCSAAEIARSLDKNSKNKGLWFDRDMLKHCGGTYRVRSRVEKIIDVNSGAMIPMKTPCIMLEDVHYSGEFQGFGEQHDFLYWREAWLVPVTGDTRSS